MVLYCTVTNVPVPVCARNRTFRMRGAVHSVCVCVEFYLKFLKVIYYVCTGRDKMPVIYDRFTFIRVFTVIKKYKHENNKKSCCGPPLCILSRGFHDGAAVGLVPVVLDPSLLEEIPGEALSRTLLGLQLVEVALLRLTLYSKEK